MTKLKLILVGVVWIGLIVLCFWYDLSILGILLLGVGVFIILMGFLLYGLSQAFAPTSPGDAIASVKESLGFDFGDDFETLSFESRNNHGDQPQHYIYKVAPTQQEALIAYCNSLEEEETVTEKKGDCKRLKIQKHMGIVEGVEFPVDFFKEFTYGSFTMPDGSIYPEFVIRIYINYGQGIIDYHSFGC